VLWLCRPCRRRRCQLVVNSSSTRRQLVGSLAWCGRAGVLGVFCLGVFCLVLFLPEECGFCSLLLSLSHFFLWSFFGDLDLGSCVRKARSTPVARKVYEITYSYSVL
jgi:hypothetical protein